MAPRLIRELVLTVTVTRKRSLQMVRRRKMSKLSGPCFLIITIIIIIGNYRRQSEMVPQKWNTGSGGVTVRLAYPQTRL